MTQRLRALLTTSAPAPQQNRLRRFAIAVTLAAIAIGGAVTPSLAGSHAASCDLVMKADR
jgi:hypothetical protein